MNRFFKSVLHRMNRNEQLKIEKKIYCSNKVGKCTGDI